MPKEQKKLNGKFLAYVRVSSKDQATGLSLDVQKNQIESYAKERDISITRFFGGVESAAQTGREEFGDMISLLQRENFQGIIFHKVDRSGRNPSDQAKLYELMEEGFEFHFVVEHITTKEHAGRTVLYLMWAIASGFSENLKLEVKKGLYGMIKKGLYPNPAPIGYKDCGHGVKEIHPILAPLVKSAFEVFSTGKVDIASIHKKFEALGMTSKHGGSIYPKTYYKMFRNPFYYGLIEYNGEKYVGAHKPIITKKLFDKVQSVLDKRSYKHTRTFQYVFAQLLTCHTCGNPLRSISARRKYKYYSCRNLACKCNIPENDLDIHFEHDLRQIEFTDEETGMFLKAVQIFNQELKSSKETDIKNIDMQMAKNKNETERLLEIYLQQQISDSDYKAMRSKLINKEMELNEQRVAFQRADNKTMLDIAEIGKLLKKPSLAYGMASDERKRFLVKSLVENFSWDGKKLITNWLKPYKVIAERPKMLVGSATENRTPI